LGKKAKEIVKANIQEVLKDLTTAYSDEWLAHYQYWLTSQWIRGIDADTLSTILEEQSKDELNHARKIAARILQLGGKPVMHPAQLVEKAGCGYKQPPEDPTDLKRVIQDVLDAEACAIEFYSRMAEKYRMSDMVTHSLFEDLLEDEVGDEEQWEKLMAKL
jgi:bacterioferritin